MKQNELEKSMKVNLENNAQTNIQSLPLDNRGSLNNSTNNFTLSNTNNPLSIQNQNVKKLIINDSEI